MLSWFDDLTELALKIVTTRFYRGVLKITKGYLLVDLEAVGDLIAEIEATRGREECPVPEPERAGVD